ncbi:hypothetical protein A8B80_16900 [Marinobacter sp. EhN04]|nr:hypothetical protein A8B80_16900 [Marinobacter sp. EhN04]
MVYRLLPYRKQLNFFWLVALTYSGYYLVLFVVATMAFLISTGLIAKLAPYLPNDLKKVLDGSPEFIPPLLSAALLYKAHDMRFFRQLDRFIVDRLLSANHLAEDYHQLKMLLENVDFFPSRVELIANMKLMEDFDVFVSNPLKEPTDLHSGDSITVWRKVSTLIRFCDACSAEDKDTRFKAQLDELREEHTRRTGVALQMLRLKLSAETFQGIEQQVDHPHPLQKVPDQEKHAALILTSEELNRTSKLLSKYLIADYKKLMSALSAIAAHYVIYSGPDSGRRLKQLVDSGFQGLGSFRELTFHKIILVLAAVFTCALVLFYIRFASFSEMPSEKAFILSINIGIIYAFSALCGALIGSSRRLKVSEEIPWGWYFLAGFLGWCAWLSVTMLTRFSPKPTNGLVEFWKEIEFFITTDLISRFPWSIPAFMFATGIALLTRINPLTKRRRDIQPHISDGIALGFVLLTGLWICLIAHHGMRTSFADKNLTPLDLSFLLESSAVCFVFAFVIGGTIIGIARDVAESGLAVEQREL